MFRPGELDGWSDDELVELYEERAAMRVPHTHRLTEGERRQAEHMAAREVMAWLRPGRKVPAKIRMGYLKFRRETQPQLFS